MTVITRSLTAAFECLKNEHPGETAHFKMDHGMITAGADATGQELLNIMMEQRGHSAISQVGACSSFDDFARKKGCAVSMQGNILSVTAPKL